jgi:hypothetical protein
MNKRQTITLFAGIGFVVLSGLFIPFRAHVSYTEKGHEKSNGAHIGYYFIFFPPSDVSACQTFLGEDYETETYGDNIKYKIKSVDISLEASRMIVQILLIVTIAGGLFFLFQDTKIPRANEQKSP